MNKSRDPTAASRSRLPDHKRGAQQRVNQIHAFKRELEELGQEGILELRVDRSITKSPSHSIH